MNKRVLIFSGLGPSIKNETYFDRTLLESNVNSGQKRFHVGLQQEINQSSFFYDDGNSRYDVLRKRNSEFSENLTTLSLKSILQGSEWSCEFKDLVSLWSDELQRDEGYFVICLSTTFICNRNDLSHAIRKISDFFPSAILVLGGQYSNLKYKQILETYSQVKFIIRGDGEEAFPKILKAVSGKLSFADVPNLVYLERGSLISTSFQYVDINLFESPRITEEQLTIPYESMRGCPFKCAFCSFPLASPKWRFKTCEKIVKDWTGYKNKGVELIKAMDSTFTIPPNRFRKLLTMLPHVGINWEAYSRSDILQDIEVVEMLENANCKTLSIGFESMSDKTLEYMCKHTTAQQNRIAELNLQKVNVDMRASFMVGYPGETPSEFNKTAKYLINEFRHRYMLNVFSLTDETMPVWNDAEKYKLKVLDSENPDYNWEHVGMNSETAFRLYKETLKRVRWENDFGVLLLWQMRYEMPLIPDLSVKDNYKLEKLIERLAFVERDYIGNIETIKSKSEKIRTQLKELKVHISNC